MVALPAMAFWRTIADRRRRLWSLAPLSLSPNARFLRRRLEDGWECRCSAISGKQDSVMASFPDGGAVQTPLWRCSQSGDAIQASFWRDCCRRSRLVESFVQAPVRSVIFRCCCRPPCDTALDVVGDRSWRRYFGVVPHRRRCASAGVVWGLLRRCFGAANDAAAGDLWAYLYEFVYLK